MLECYEDADNAIQLDEMNIKAHLLAGSALLEIGKGEQSNKKIE